MAMKIEAQKPVPGSPPQAGTKETFSDENNKIVSTQLSRDEFLANEDQKMRAFVQLYEDHCADGQAPMLDAIPPEKIAMTGMMSRTHCLRTGKADDDFRYSVWAQDAAFDGFRSLQNANVGELTAYQTYGVLFEAVKHQLAVTKLQRQPTFFEVKGQANDHYYYFTKAVLPLRNEKGEIVKCLVPFTNKLPDVPTDLRDKLFSIDVD